MWVLAPKIYTYICVHDLWIFLRKAGPDQRDNISRKYIKPRKRLELEIFRQPREHWIAIFASSCITRTDAQFFKFPAKNTCAQNMLIRRSKKSAASRMKCRHNIYWLTARIYMFKSSWQAIYIFTRLINNSPLLWLISIKQKTWILNDFLTGTQALCVYWNVIVHSSSSSSSSGLSYSSSLNDLNTHDAHTGSS
jgi:hypothetical protein